MDGLQRNVPQRADQESSQFPQMEGVCFVSESAEWMTDCWMVLWETKLKGIVVKTLITKKGFLYKHFSIQSTFEQVFLIVYSK